MKYLEWYSYTQTIHIDRYTVEQTVPTKSYVPEHVIADLMDIFETTKILLSTLGYHIFDKKREHNKGLNSLSKENIFYCRGKGIEAVGEYSDEGFVVFKGSQMVLEKAASMKTYANLRDKLILDKIVIQKNQHYVFKSDYIFKPPSEAGSVVLGRSSNGWVVWKNEEGKSMDEVIRKSI